MTAYEQRSYTGNAADTKLTADMTAGATSFSVTAGTGSGYPDGSGGPFFVFIDYDNSKIEKVRCSGRINDTFTVAGSGGGRGQDGTTAQTHTTGANVRHGPTATDLQEANRAAANTVGLVTTKGDLVAATGANAMARVPASASGAPLVADTTQTAGVKFDSGGWTSYTPTFTNVTSGAGVFAYKQYGKTLYLRGYFTAGTATAINQVGVSLPGGLTAAGANTIYQFVAGGVAPGTTVLSWDIVGTTSTLFTANSVSGSVVGYGFTGVIEIA